MSTGKPPSGGSRRNDKGKALYDSAPRGVRPGADEADPDVVESFRHRGLSVVDDEGSASSPARSNEKGLQSGYNPYNSGALYKQTYRKKRDMRELSKWIELKKKLAKRKSDD